MRTDDDIEAYLMKMELPFESLGKGLWVVHDEENLIENIVIYHNPPIVTIQVKVMPVPKGNREQLFEKLLMLNATELVHGAYGIEEEAIVLVDTIQSPNLDLNELQASIDAVALALASHYDALSAFKDTSQTEAEA